MQPVLAGILAVIAISVVAIFVAYQWSDRPRPEVGIRLAAPVASLGEGQAIRFEAPPGKRFAVLQGGDVRDATVQAGWLARHNGRLIAVAVRTRVGCSVNFVASQSVFIDPCTGTSFALDGRPLSGTAAASLAQLAWHTISADSIAVTVRP